MLKKKNIVVQLIPTVFNDSLDIDPLVWKKET
jgi:hypothetical protein